MRNSRMDAPSFEWVIDKAKEMCGSQNDLAKAIGIASGTMSEYRNGKRSVPDHVIEKLAEVAGMKAADVWLLAQDARNPFRPESKVATTRNEGCQVGLNSSDFPLRTLGKIFAVLRVYNPSRFARRTSFPA